MLVSVLGLVSQSGPASRGERGKRMDQKLDALKGAFCCLSEESDGLELHAEGRVQLAGHVGGEFKIRWGLQHSSTPALAVFLGKEIMRLPLLTAVHSCCSSDQHSCKEEKCQGRPHPFR